jgi:AraC-like DNA-binding protein
MEKSLWHEKIDWDKSFGLNIFHRLWKPMHHQILRLHWHEHIEIIYQLQGESHFYFEGERVNSQPGDILIINSGMLHEGHSVKKQGRFNEYYAIVFHPSMLKGHTMELDDYRQYIEPYLKGQRIFPNKISKDNEYHPQALLLYQQILREFYQKQIGYRINITSLLIQFCINCDRLQASVKPAQLPSHNIIRMREKYNARFKSLFEYIEQHYDQKVSLDYAAQRVNMSRYHFCKVFKQLTGKTFNEYINSYRVIEAERLLILQPDLAIQEIAERSGFSSIHYMYRLFRKYKKGTPAAFRLPGRGK